MSNIKLLYPLSNFFPRKNPSNTSLVDEGDFEKHICTTKDCCGFAFESISIEYCPTCGYFVDYWATGSGDENKKYFTSHSLNDLNQWYLKMKIVTLLKSENCLPGSYSLSFSLKKI